MAESSGQYTTAEQIARLLGLSHRRVQQLRAEGAMVTEKVGNETKYLLAPSLIQYIKYLQSKQDKAAVDERIKMAEADLKERKAALAGLELSRRKGEVHDAEHVQILMNAMILETRAALIGLPSRVAMRCYGKSVNEISNIIKGALNQVMMEMSQKQYDPDKFEELVRAEGDWLATGLEDDESAARTSVTGEM